MRLLPLLTALLVSASAAPAAGADRTVTSPGQVIGLARSGYSVAFLSGPYKGHCGPHVEIWSLVSGGVFRLGRHTDAICNEHPSGGSGVTDLAVAGTRALWLAHAGGNLTDWVLETATTTRPVERQLEFAEVETGDPSPIVLGVASESVMPYSIGSKVKALAPNGKLLYTWQAPARVTNTTAYNGQVAVFVAGGHCYVLSPAGAVQQTYSFARGAVQELALAGAGLIVQLPAGKIEIHKGASPVKKLTIPPGARMLDFAESILLYRLGGQIRARRVASGKDVLLRHGFLAQLEHNGLTYAVGRRVYSVAMVNVNAALNR
jgi:hypothetical protein